MKMNKFPFKPFRVQIIPIWESMLVDNKLLDPKKWKSWENDYLKKSKEESVLNWGFVFTMISPDLYYSNQEYEWSSRDNSNLKNRCNQFQSKLSMQETISGLTDPNDNKKPIEVDIYAGEGDDGYIIGLKIPNTDGLSDEYRELAKFPIEALNQYFREESIENEEARNKALNELDWQIHNDELINILKHKYFIITHQQI